MKKALKILLARHPFLGAIIEFTGERTADFIFSSVEEVPLEIFRQEPGADRWLEIFERQANFFLKVSEPLARVVLLLPEEGDVDESGLYSQYVYLTIHHGIEDGTCCTNLLSEILEVCSCIDTNTTSPIMEEKRSLVATPPDLQQSRDLDEESQTIYDERVKPIQDRITKLVAETVSVGKPMKRTVVKELVDEVNALDKELYEKDLQEGCYDNKKFRISKLRALLKEIQNPISMACPAPPKNYTGEKYTAIFPIRLSEEDTKKIVNGCRANGTTVHAALLAGLAFAATQHLKDNNDDIIYYPINSAVNLRKRLGIDKKDLGFYASGLNTNHLLVPGETNFWDLARDAKAQLNTGSERDLAILTHSLGERLSPGMQMFIERFEMFKEGPPIFRSLVISNMGVADLKENYGPYEVESLLQTACCGGLSETILFATTTRNRMFLNVSYSRGFVTDEEASKTLNDVLFYVFAAIDNPHLKF